ncbi:adenylate/guanylate cyclase domain-containing protein [Deinococcus koreensis]|uniref:Adenylate/guanylate cyclase domain-containing protein n=1 Tax=Deinococcus koreensis TaxID=2054903 RepID=A0A2K3UZC9_9DEIO|nr:adenylate/guanylate cyclase domain-containing protein [Deinococcus koreensis]PNY81875.1 adenylate/guanylate cyclase domain-containing protein [Deinococcus koreensis]
MPKLLPLPSASAETSTACLVLVDLVASTALAQTLPLPHYMALMSEFVQVMVLSFEARGGQVLQHQGDAVLGYWEADQTVQASRAALESHDRAGRLGLAGLLGVRLQLRAGVASGEVLTGMVAGQRSAYGLPVNYARRLCDGAQPGGTLACCRVVRELSAQLSWKARPPQEFQGFGTDCEAFELGWPTDGAGQMHMKVD